jgi:hypothetical protein
VNHKRYLVTGKRRYRDHEPGCTFEAKLDPDAERRAIERGSIRVLTVVSPDLENGSYVLPEDWSQDAADAGTTRAADGVSRMN